MQMLYLEDMSKIEKKIRVLLADTGKSRKELAIGIERSPQTISGYISTSPVSACWAKTGFSGTSPARRYWISSTGKRKRSFRGWGEFTISRATGPHGL